MKNEVLKERLIHVLQEGAAGGGVRRTTSYDEERENGVVVAINPTHTEVEIDFGVFADALIDAGIRFGENLTATFGLMALVREHELERRLAESEHRAEVAERALQKACCYIDALGEGCGCCAFIKDDLKCRENCDFLAGLTTFWRNKAEEELKVENGK